MLNADNAIPIHADVPESAELFVGIGKDPVWAQSAATRRAYESDWVAFTLWCDQNHQTPLPAAVSTVAAYIADRASLVNESGDFIYAVSTIARWVCAINARHRRADLRLPGASNLVKNMLAGLQQRSDGRTRRMAPLLLADLKIVLTHIDLQSFPQAVIGYRDWALLVMGFVGAFRRSELAERTIGDVSVHAEEGLRICLLTSNSDATSGGPIKRLPFGMNPLTCPPCAFVRWARVLDAAENTAEGPTKALLAELRTDAHICHGHAPVLERLDPSASLFRAVRRGGHIGSDMISGDVINYVVKRRLAAVGLDPRRFGGHSLRAGFVTQALLDGAPPREIQQQTGHRNIADVERYRRRSDLLHENAVTRLAL